MSLNVRERNHFRFSILMKELKKLDGVKAIGKKAQKLVVGGCPSGGGPAGCPAGMCGQIIFPGPDYFCVPC